MAAEIKSLTSPSWPEGVRLPVVLTFEHQAGEGVASRPGDRFNANAFGQTEYGARSGIWHILEMLDRVGVKSTFFVSGIAAERYPEAIQAALAAGHDIAGMGYSFEKVRTASWQREQSIVRRSAKALQDVCGAAIRGWRCPDYRISPQTFDVLSSEGFVWDSSMLNDDLPYLFQCESGHLIEVPFTTSTADKAYVAWPNPVCGGSPALANVWEMEFDVLYREATLAPRFMILSLQTWASGRPVTLRTLRQFIERVKTYNDAPFVRCDEIAAWSKNTLSPVF